MIDKMKLYQGKPVFKHDCTSCHFVQTIQVEGEFFDVYHHMQADGVPDDIVARYGNDGHEYFNWDSDTLIGLRGDVAVAVRKMLFKRNFYSWTPECQVKS